MVNRKVNPDSIRQRCLAVVRRLGSASINQVLAEVGRAIPTSQALVCGRKDRANNNRRCRDLLPQRKTVATVDSMSARGRRMLVSEALCDLYEKGILTRVSRGVYAVPQNGKVPHNVPS